MTDMRIAYCLFEIEESMIEISSLLKSSKLVHPSKVHLIIENVKDSLIELDSIPKEHYLYENAQSLNKKMLGVLLLLFIRTIKDIKFFEIANSI
jgi:hypothetical protein